MRAGIYFFGLVVDLKNKQILRHLLFCLKGETDETSACNQFFLNVLTTGLVLFFKILPPNSTIPDDTNQFFSTFPPQVFGQFFYGIFPVGILSMDVVFFSSFARFCSCYVVVNNGSFQPFLYIMFRQVSETLWETTFCQLGSLTLEIEMSNEKRARSCLGYVGDEILPSYEVISHHKDPY